MPELQKELTELIMKKDIKARIDSHNKIIYARQADQEVCDQVPCVRPCCAWVAACCTPCRALVHLLSLLLSARMRCPHREQTLLRTAPPVADTWPRARRARTDAIPLPNAKRRCPPSTRRCKQGSSTSGKPRRCYCG